MTKPEKLRALAGWLDLIDKEAGCESNEVQKDLREIADVVDSIKFIADALGEEVRLRHMIDLWCIDQLGNTDEALQKADEMFAAAKDIFYRSINPKPNFPKGGIEAMSDELAEAFWPSKPK